jgi:hypothetical protein
MISADEGWAVGGGFSGNWDIGYLDVILHWNGTAWEFGAPPDSLDGFFSSLSIVASDDVYATNIFGLFHWDGTLWRETEDPQVGQAYGIDMYNTDEGWVTAWNGAISHWDGQRWEMVFDRTHNIAAVDAITPHEAWAVCGEWSGGGILHYTAPVPVRDTLAPDESLVHSYAGHETRITLGSATGLNADDVFTISYKLRPNSQGNLKGIDHFFEIAADRLDLFAPLTVTVRFSDTQEFGVYPGTTGLYRLSGSDWVTDGIAIVDAQADRLEAVVTQSGGFGVMGHEGHRILLPVVLRDQ